MKVGQWPGCVVDYGVGKASTGTPFVIITLSVDTGGSLESIDWTGYLTQNAKDKTIETLQKLGFNGNLASLAGGRDTACLENGKEIIADIVNEPYNGEDKFKVKWINLKGEQHGIKKVGLDEGLAILNQFKADFLAAKTKPHGLDL
jgi:hypothetical protein